MRRDGVDNICVFLVLLGQICAELNVRALLLVVDGLAYIVQKTCTLCEVYVEAELGGHEASKLGNFNGMLVHILAVTCPVL